MSRCADAARTVTALLDGYSLEVAAKAVPALALAADQIPRGTPIFIPYLPSEDNEARLAAAARIRALGFEPTLHLPARRIGSLTELEALVSRAVAEAGVERCFVIGGDAATPLGPFADSLSLIETGVLERSGIRSVGVAGHPESHPAMDETTRLQVLVSKCAAIQERRMRPEIVTQFGFDAGPIVQWLQALRVQGVTPPVRIGVPGPAGIAVLARYAAMCGVSASAAVVAKYARSMGRLLGSAGPDHFVHDLAAALTSAHGAVSLHLFPFGGVERTVDWLRHYRSQGRER